MSLGRLVRLPRSAGEWHRLSGLALIVFITAHLANHLVAFIAGPDAHRSVMEALRMVYRFAPVEMLILAAAATQIVTGVPRAIHALKWHPTSLIGRVQPLSGLVLAVFLVVHVGAVLAGRMAFGLDTDLRFAAAGFQAGPWVWFFAPYYWLAVFAFFAHAGAAAHWVLRPRGPARLADLVFRAALVAGAVMATILVLALAGIPHPVPVDPVYLAPYGH